MRYKLGKDLEVGDEVNVWWATGEMEDEHNVATLLKLVPYEGVFTNLFSFVGIFTGLRDEMSMTIDPDHRFRVFNSNANNTFEIE